MRTSLYLLLTLAVFAAACGGRGVEIISSTPSSPTATTPSSPPVTAERHVRISGTVVAVAGTCPALMIQVAGTSVTTSSTTTFASACGYTVKGAFVDVDGDRQADGSIAATGVEVRQVSASGTIAALTGSCPSTTFTLGSTTIVTTASTILENLSCSQVANGTAVRVQGYRQADGSIAATVVSRDGRS